MTLVLVRYKGLEPFEYGGSTWKPDTVREVKLGVARVLIKRRGTNNFNIEEPEDAAAEALEPQEVDYDE